MPREIQRTAAIFLTHCQILLTHRLIFNAARMNALRNSY